MNSQIKYILLCVVMLVFYTTSARTTRHVVHIGIDGLNPLCISNSSNAGINMAIRMTKQGSATFVNARTVIETVSAPGWIANLCSMTSVTSGVHGNSWIPPWLPYNGKPSITPITGTHTPLPTIFNVLKSQNDKIQTAMIYDWKWLSYLGNKSISGSIDFERFYSLTDCLIDSDTYITRSAIEFIESLDINTPSYMFIYFHSVDTAGHKYGWCGKEYENQVGFVDELIGEILNTIENRIPNDTLIMLSSDHGGRPGQFNHGEANNECLNVPIILQGPQIRKNYHLSVPIRNMDLIPTAVYMMGFKPHWAWEGKIIYEAIEDN